jgi:hypothetical protein
MFLMFGSTQLSKGLMRGYYSFLRLRWFYSPGRTAEDRPLVWALASAAVVAVISVPQTDSAHMEGAGELSRYPTLKLNPFRKPIDCNRSVPVGDHQRLRRPARRAECCRFVVKLRASLVRPVHGGGNQSAMVVIEVPSQRAIDPRIGRNRRVRQSERPASWQVKAS